jgi:hypothetical protein
MGGVQEVSAKPSPYVTLLSSDSYLEGVLTLNESLRRVQSAHPLDALITEALPLQVGPPRSASVFGAILLLLRS